MIGSRKTIGYELCKSTRGGREYHSFRIHGPGGGIVPGMDCPLVFDTAAKAKACAEQLRKAGNVVSKHSS